MKLKKTNPIRWWSQVILVGFGLLLCMYALLLGKPWSEWIPVLATFILIGVSIECPLLSSNEESDERT